MLSDIDYIAVGREAHQLSATYRRDAWIYAERWAQLADTEGRADEAAFWSAVSHALKPR
jgi:hypothetical protein